MFRKILKALGLVKDLPAQPVLNEDDVVPTIITPVVIDTYKKDETAPQLATEKVVKAPAIKQPVTKKMPAVKTGTLPAKAPPKKKAPVSAAKKSAKKKKST